MGRVALVTGGTRGIGAAISTALKDAGYTVAANYAGNDDAAKKFSDETGIKTYKWSVADYDACKDGIAQVESDLGPVDVLVNNAGITRDAPFHKMTPEQWHQVIDTNLSGVFNMTHPVWPGMRERKGGHIINISSIGAQTNTPRFSAYVSSKSALDSFARSIASEVIDDEVYITTVYMPLVRTPMIEPTGMYDAFPTATPEEAAELVTGAMVSKTKKVATRLGTFGEVLYALAPKSVDVILNTAYKLFPDTPAARGKKEEREEPVSSEGVAFAYLMRGVHW